MSQPHPNPARPRWAGPLALALSAVAGGVVGHLTKERIEMALLKAAEVFANLQAHEDRADAATAAKLAEAQAKVDEANARADAAEAALAAEQDGLKRINDLALSDAPPADPAPPEPTPSEPAAG